MSFVAADAIDLSPLIRPGVARLERFSSEEPITFMQGPILSSSGIRFVNNIRYLHLCQTCHNVLRSHRLPANALANGRWVGSTPPALQSLSYVEQLIIAKYRHSFCVAQVTTSGQRYLAANVIVFGQPVDRVYTTLPPPRADIEACLAILFVGSARPSDEDVRRTPFLVRHRKVMAALRWLKLNHPLYTDLTISQANMDSYPQDTPPVGIVYRPAPSSTPAESLPVYETSSERETATGDAPFVVHGLDGPELARMSYDAKIALAVKHLDDGHAALAYGHYSQPESIYHNSTLYPGMFPWLYPYGLGGFENEHMLTRLHRSDHIRACLQYEDRRFQTDRCFPFIVFNQEQIRSSSQGGYLLTSRKNFSSVADKLANIDRAALDELIDRSEKGAYIKPETDAEKACFELIAFVDHVAGHVKGSNTSRKYQRNEIRSLIYAKGVPIFFVTFAPADFKNPLCLYYCGQKIDLMNPVPLMPGSDDRLRAIASNPVGAAKFFHKTVQLFVKCILRHDRDDYGLFGPSEAFYGTVEAQGRLTLHLHTLLWIKPGSVSPQEIRDRLLADPSFERALLHWLEDCHSGDYAVSSSEALSSELEEEYMKRMPSGESKLSHRLKRSVRDPATTRPSPPRANSTASETSLWFKDSAPETDRIVFVSNRHDPNHGKGCWRNNACRARFPRPLFETTMVDRTTGAIRFAKKEPWINTYNPVLTFLFRHNTDVTCLLSGTQVKAVMAYVSDYITKPALNTHTFFEIVRAVLDRHTESLNDPDSDRDRTARGIIVKIVNALSGASEIGGPAVCAALLGNPDHYSSENFKVFYWYAYVQHATRTSVSTATAKLPEDRLLLVQTLEGVVGTQKLHDYLLRPTEHASWSLYDFLRRTDVRKLRGNQVFATSPVNDDNHTDDSESDRSCEEGPVSHPVTAPSARRFQRNHPLFKTHGVYVKPEATAYVLNFVGRALPRPDKGDREEYCLTMLVFFHPRGWRTGLDLKSPEQSWADAFAATTFSPQSMQIMKNMNVLYECHDARDDYAAQRRTDGIACGVDGTNQTSSDSVPFVDPEWEFTEQSLIDSLEDGAIGPRTARSRKEMDTMIAMLPHSGSGPTIRTPHTRKSYPTHSASQWKAIVTAARMEAISELTIPRSERVASSGATPSTTRSDGMYQPIVAPKTLAQLRRMDPTYHPSPNTSRLHFVLQNTWGNSPRAVCKTLGYQCGCVISARLKASKGSKIDVSR